ncbi:MAG: hypothetical protein A2665_00505 [Candidatus Zambryskibacteria bacterium RIFCSPHIGHO2_01_FULL_46_30]|uniref:DNA polymerase III delta subunit-like C-terminal domain-containing protein n=1 Tax=Candidatus Zambryskibacteria bacterium RIFCSPHIGHO2_01_FULL_46_30 TaxID=1802739 RepID=A0A1G2T587_9BACT|nr:MAG: hypothetical protein A2665_00505 [Candidatus Zambryskibacteria bacterium RIFCSPHIGHO2_01_FULL_46_30]OHB05981.1 MAG: hypothetical protein A3B22_01270 [Candidatus Zambryskibacteria bacterium RIFCSPLOWO2_01_FULL_47_33]
MTEEFYHKDIFGTVVDMNLTGEERSDLNTRSQGLTLVSRREFNIFALTDALGARQRKEAWILYQQALEAGLTPEEIFFKIVWQVKSMLIASRTRNVGETEMKAFPYNKAKSFLKNFKSGELKKLSESLVVGYHRARRGEVEIETLVEKLLLGL